MAQFGMLQYPWRVGNPFKIGPRRTSTSPTAYGLWAIKNQKWPKMARFQDFEKVSIGLQGPVLSHMVPKCPLKTIWDQYFNNCGYKTPVQICILKDLVQEETSRCYGRFLGVARHSYSHYSPFFKLETIVASVLGFSPWPPTLLDLKQIKTPGRKITQERK
ncbi:hypothetical protein O181_085133 [Austropuccinia psidii MF-1]|uniref:Uncharacterized protein n=1 Tax=Austropuccinia psidii MF-1 TaxID=1389203 RepID=A0A9Q3FSK5_9BASI|nr:hypothetical protein [Austropuccinia psidii MF-1]